MGKAWGRHGERSLRSLRARLRLARGYSLARAPRLAGGSAPSLFLSGVYRHQTTCPVGARACGASRPAELWPHEKKGIRMEGIKKDGAKSFDAGMPECQSVRMPECQNVRVSECQNVRMPAMTEARGGAGGRASGCRRGGARDGGRTSQSFSRGRRPALPQHSILRRGARVKGGLGDDGKKVIFAMSP